MNIFNFDKNKFHFNKTSLDRLLRKDAIAKQVKYTNIVLFLLIVFFSVLTLRTLITGLLQQEIAVSDMENSLLAKISNINREAKQKDKKPINYKKLSKQQIFGKITGGPQQTDNTTQRQSTNKPTTKVELKLVGVFLWDDGIASATIVESKKPDTEENYFINENINESTKLVAVYPDKVEIETNGVRELLYFEDVQISSEKNDSNVPTSTINIDEKELDDALSNLPLLLQQARAVPYFKDGKSIGLRLFAIRPGSLYEKIGLQNGDILKEINGTSLSDITQAVKLFERLKKEKDITLKLERQRADKTLLYTIR